MAEGLASTITVRLDDRLMTALRKHCAATSQNMSDAVRTLLADALFAEDEPLYGRQCRTAVREELDAWMASERISRALAADDFYDRLSVGIESELADIRALAGAALLVASDTEARAGGYMQSAGEIAEDAVARGPYVAARTDSWEDGAL